MKASLRAIVLLTFLTLAAGVLGGWFGVVYGERLAGRPGDLHSMIHSDLGLTSAQDEKIAVLERRFAARRAALDAEMRAANRDLANALVADHAFGPRELAATQRFHRAQEQLQEATIRHVLAMRAILTAEQSKRFDQAVYEALTAGPS